MTQELAKYEAGVALTVGAHCSIGMRGLLLFGNGLLRRAMELAGLGADQTPVQEAPRASAPPAGG